LNDFYSHILEIIGCNGLAFLVKKFICYSR
jgi:hypothetical protein